MAELKRQDLMRRIEVQESALRQLETLSSRQIKQYSRYFDIVKNDDMTFSFIRSYLKIDILAANNGFFCLLTNTNINSSEALRVYKRRDVIEKSFDDIKNHIDMKKLHTHIDETTNGKLFCAFIALIAVSEITTKIRSVKDKIIRKMSNKTVISELEKIKVITLSGTRRLINPVTKKQRLILEAFGLTEEDLKIYVAN
jgi:hypothetical protein